MISDIVWLFLHECIRKNTLKQFKSRLHFIQTCKYYLFWWKQTPTPLCEVCNVVDDYQHMFLVTYWQDGTSVDAGLLEGFRPRRQHHPP